MVRPCARKMHQPGYACNSGSPYFAYGEIPGLRLAGSRMVEAWLA